MVHEPKEPNVVPLRASVETPPDYKEQTDELQRQLLTQLPDVLRYLFPNGLIRQGKFFAGGCSQIKFTSMELKTETRNNTLILRLSGDLIGEDNGLGVLEAVGAAISAGIQTCIIDISGLRYINSSGIGVLITVLTKFRNKGGEVYLMKPSESVQKLLVITKLNAIFQVIQKEDEVL